MRSGVFVWTRLSRDERTRWVSVLLQMEPESRNRCQVSLMWLITSAAAARIPTFRKSDDLWSVISTWQPEGAKGRILMGKWGRLVWGFRPVFRVKVSNVRGEATGIIARNTGQVCETQHLRHLNNISCLKCCVTSLLQNTFHWKCVGENLFYYQVIYCNQIIILSVSFCLFVSNVSTVEKVYNDAKQRKEIRDISEADTRVCLGILINQLSK